MPREWDLNPQPRAALVVLVQTSRELTDDDNGRILECATSLTLTVPLDLALHFACAVIPAGTTTVQRVAGVLLNGGTAAITRAAAANAMFAIQMRRSVLDSYIVTGT